MSAVAAIALPITHTPPPIETHREDASTPPPTNNKRARVCPETPITHFVQLRQLTAQQIKENLYRNTGLPLGEQIGEGSYCLVYQNKDKPTEVIKIPHYRIWAFGVAVFEQTVAYMAHVQASQVFKDSGLFLAEAKLHKTQTGLVFLTQTYYPKETRFCTATHLNIPEVKALIERLFLLCRTGQLPALDLTPSNLVYADGKLGLIDWLIPQKNAQEESPGALFRLHENSMKLEFGPHFLRELPPSTEE